MSDAKLLRRAQQGDANAWRTLYARYLPAMWRFVSAKLGDTHATEDIISETMLAFVSAANEMDLDDCNVFGWLRTVARRKICDHYRSKSRQDQLVNRLAGQDADQDSGKSDIISISQGSSHLRSFVRAVETPPLVGLGHGLNALIG